MARTWIWVVGIVLALCGCLGEKGVDRVISMKSLDKLEEYAKEMSPEEAEIFEQTVLADIRAATLQVGLSIMADTFKTKADPSRDADTSEIDAAIGRLAAMEGKTIRAAMVESLQSHRAPLEGEKRLAEAQAQAESELRKQIEAIPFRVSKVEVERNNSFGRTYDTLSLAVDVKAPAAPAVFVRSFTVSVAGEGGQGTREIGVKGDLRLPCSECSLHLYSSADPVEGYPTLPRSLAAFTVKVKEWSAVDLPYLPAVDIGDLDRRLAVLDRKIALISKAKGR